MVRLRVAFALAITGCAPMPAVDAMELIRPHPQESTRPEVLALQEERPAGEYPVAWPGPNPDVHRWALFKNAILGPIGQLGEYAGECWVMSIGVQVAPLKASLEGGVLRVELNQIGLLRVNGEVSGPALNHRFDGIQSIDTAEARRMGGQWQKWK